MKTTRTFLFFSWLIRTSFSAAFSLTIFGNSRRICPSLESVRSKLGCLNEIISHGEQIRNKFQLSVQKDGYQCNNSDDDKSQKKESNDKESLKHWLDGKVIKNEVDPRRRNVITLPAVMATILMDLQRQPAIAEENILEMDQNKIVMQMNSNNLPKKYASSEISLDSSGQSDLTEAEWTRINVFEKAAPSVVYIDTFVEQRDAFSTNVMEVPLGTGSGFVW